MPEPPAVADVDPEAAVRLVAEGAVLLDVREDDEWEAGHAPDATHLAMGLVADGLDRLPPARPLICVCRVGSRSAAVAGALVSAGFDARNLAGGMQAWQLAGLPVVAAGRPGRVL